MGCPLILKAGSWFNCNRKEYGGKSGNKKRAINCANALAYLGKVSYIKYSYIKKGKEWQNFYFSIDTFNFKKLSNLKKLPSKITLYNEKNELIRTKWSNSVSKNLF